MAHIVNTLDNVRAFLPTMYKAEGMTFEDIYRHVTLDCDTCDIDVTIHEAIRDLHNYRVMEIEAGEELQRARKSAPNDVHKWFVCASNCESIVMGAFGVLVRRVNESHERPFNLTTATMHVFGFDGQESYCDTCRDIDLMSMSDREFTDTVNWNHRSDTPLVELGARTPNTCDWCDELSTRIVRTRHDSWTNATCDSHAARWAMCNDDVSVIVR